MNLVLTFDSTHFALSGEKKIKESGIAVQLIPTPRSVSSRCGFSLQLSDIDLDIILDVLLNKKINYNDIYSKTLKDEITYYEKIKF